MDLVRKIQIAKWERKSGLRDDEIPADVTPDLRTGDNNLSLWKYLPNETGLDDVFLALAAGQQELDKMDVAWISDQNLEKDGIRLQGSPGTTPVVDLRDRHVDAVQLDLTRLGKIANRVAAAIDDQHCHRKTRAEIIELLGQAVKAGRVDPVALGGKVRAKVEEYLNGAV